VSLSGTAGAEITTLPMAPARADAA